MQEQLGKRIEKPMQRKQIDVRKEAQDLVQKHERLLTNLRETALSPDAFREASLKATESFKSNLKDFLSKHGAEDLYEEMVGFVMGKVGEIVKKGGEKSGK